MNKKKTIVRILGVLIFSIGVLLGIALFGAAVWGDLEADLFDTALRADAKLTSLKCPVVMTANEIGTVGVTLDNPLDRPIEFTIRTHISQGYITLMREIDSKLPLEPGEKQTLEWEVTSEDAAYYGRLILIRVRVSPRYPIPRREASCGILVVDLPGLSGNQVFALTLAGSLLSMAVGAGLWVATYRPLKGLGLDVIRAMGALAGSVLIGMVAGFLGQWMPGVLILAITVLLIGAIVGYFVNRIGRKPV